MGTRQQVLSISEIPSPPSPTTPISWKLFDVFGHSPSGCQLSSPSSTDTTRTYLNILLRHTLSLVPMCPCRHPAFIRRHTINLSPFIRSTWRNKLVYPLLKRVQWEMDTGFTIFYPTRICILCHSIHLVSILCPRRDVVVVKGDDGSERPTLEAAFPGRRLLSCHCPPYLMSRMIKQQDRLNCLLSNYFSL